MPDTYFPSDLLRRARNDDWDAFQSNLLEGVRAEAESILSPPAPAGPDADYGAGAWGSALQGPPAPSAPPPAAPPEPPAPRTPFDLSLGDLPAFDATEKSARALVKSLTPHWDWSEDEPKPETRTTLPGPEPRPAGETVSGGGLAASGRASEPREILGLPRPQIDVGRGRDDVLRAWAPTLKAVEAGGGPSARNLAAIILAENGAGQSPLSAKDNNWFSISAVGRPFQAGAGTGGRFARYESPNHSLADFVDLIKNSDRYKEAWALRNAPPEQFMGALARAGYIAPEPGFPIETWLRNTALGAQTFDRAAGDIGAASPPPGPIAGTGQALAREKGELTPNQFTAGRALSSEEAYAACGPAAAVAFARANGRNPTLDEAVQLARSVGWSPGRGMAGPQSQVALLGKMGVAAKTGAPDEAKVRADVERGNPVIIDTPGHYFVAERYDAQSGKFDFGNSATALRASGGKRWFSLAEIGSLGMGAPRTAIFMDSPESPSPSAVAGRSSEPGVEVPPELAPAVVHASSQPDEDYGTFANRLVEQVGKGFGGPAQSRSAMAATDAGRQGLLPDAGGGPARDTWATDAPQSAGLLEPGTINLNARPVARNPDGSISTERSMSFEDDDGTETLIPTLGPDGRIMSAAEAVDLYRRTGQHLGKFDSPESADRYARTLHEGQGERYGAERIPGLADDAVQRQIPTRDDYARTGLDQPEPPASGYPMPTDVDYGAGARTAGLQGPTLPEPSAPAEPTPAPAARVSETPAQQGGLGGMLGQFGEHIESAIRTTVERALAPITGALKPPPEPTVMGSEEMLTKPALTEPTMPESLTPQPRASDDLTRPAISQPITEAVGEAAGTVSRAIGAPGRAVTGALGGAAGALNEALIKPTRRDIERFNELADRSPEWSFTRTGSARAAAGPPLTPEEEEELRRLAPLVGANLHPGEGGLARGAFGQPDYIAPVTGALRRGAGAVAEGAGGLARGPLGRAAMGAGAGAASEYYAPSESGEERAGRMALGAAAGVLGGRRAVRETVGGLVVDPATARRLPFRPGAALQVPELRRAVEVAGGKVTPEGIEIDLTRYQKSEQVGGEAARGGVFYLGGKVPASEHPFHDTSPFGTVGGGQRIEGETLFRNPLVGGVERPFLEEVGEQLGYRDPNWHNLLQRDAGRIAYEPQRNQVAAMAHLLEQYGGDPSAAARMVADLPDEEWGYGALENVIATRARAAGHDALIGLDRQAPELSPFDKDTIGRLELLRDEVIPSWSETIHRADIAGDHGYAATARDNLTRAEDELRRLTPAVEAIRARMRDAPRGHVLDEVMDLREGAYPGPGGEFELRPELSARMAPTDAAREIANIERRMPEREARLAEIGGARNAPALRREVADLENAQRLDRDRLEYLRGSAAEPPEAPAIGLEARPTRSPFDNLKRAIDEGTDEQGNLNPRMQAAIEQIAKNKMTTAHAPEEHVARNVAAHLVRRAEEGATPGTTWLDNLIKYRNLGMLSGPSQIATQTASNVLMTPLALATEYARAVAHAGAGPVDIAREIGSINALAFEGFLDGLRQVPSVVRGEKTLSQGLVEQATGRAATGARPGTAELLYGAPARLGVEAPDQLFWNAWRRSGELAKAAEVAERRGLRGPEAYAEAKRMVELLDAPGRLPGATVDEALDEIRKAGVETANIWTFKTDAGRLSSLPEAFRDSTGPFGRIILPFFHATTQIYARGIDMTPLGIAGTAADVARGAYQQQGVRRLLPEGLPGVLGEGAKRPRGVIPLEHRIALNAAGAVTFTAGYALALNGGVTGAGPDDADIRRDWMDQGWRPHSFLVGGQYVPLALLGPVGVSLGMAANLAESQMAGGGAGAPPTEPGKATNSIMRRLSSQAADQTFVGNLRAFFDLAGAGGKVDEWPQTAAQFLGGMARSFLPESGLLGATAAEADPYTRKFSRAKTLPDVGPVAAEQVQSAIPGALRRVPGIEIPTREQLPPRRRLMGELQPNPRAGLFGLLGPRTSPQQVDPVVEAYSKIGMTIAEPPKSVSLERGVKLDLSKPEQERYRELRGQQLREIWDEADRPTDEASLKALIREANKAAGDLLLTELSEADPDQLERRAASR